MLKVFLKKNDRHNILQGCDIYDIESVLRECIHLYTLSPIIFILFKKIIKRGTPETAIIFDIGVGHTDPKHPLQLGTKIELDRITEKICFK